MQTRKCNGRPPRTKKAIKSNEPVIESAHNNIGSPAGKKQKNRKSQQRSDIEQEIEAL